METKPEEKKEVFVGIEHLGLYPTGASAADIAQWYVNKFGLESKEIDVSYFLSGKGPGRIEVMKNPAGTACHIAVQVSDFEAAVAMLEKEGVKFKKPVIEAHRKLVYLEEPDPAGNLVHLMWVPPK